MTTMPRALAAGTSTLSTPVPARAITRSRGAAAISAAVTFVALRTTSASASARSARKLVGRAAGAGVDRPAFGAQEIERGGGEIIGDDDFHGAIPIAEFTVQRRKRAAAAGLKSHVTRSLAHANSVCEF